jgi:amino acid transporter
VGIPGLDAARLSPATWSSPLHLVAGGMIIFLAYEGFELIANTAADVREPARTLPRAFYSAVAFVIVLYVLVALVAVGTLPLDEIVDARDYALAQAATPVLGQTGFTLIAVAAMLSTASAINATLYGAARVSYMIARDGELPAVLERKIWNEPLEGLLITSGVTLVVANLVDLSSLSTMGSAGFLVIFAAVNAANARLAGETGGGRRLSVAGVVLCLSALATLLWQTALTAPTRIWFLVVMIAVAFAIEFAFRLATGRALKLFNSGGD